MEELIVLENVSKDYDGNIVIKEVNLNIIKGQTLGIVGANGTGKSTLMRIIAGLSKVSDGKRLLKSENIRISYVPEHFPKLNFTPVEYLHHMGLFKGLSISDIDEQIQTLFDIFDMQLMKNTMIKYLSKGSMQKVAVIQSLLSQPDILLLDEPLSGQDINSQERFVEMIQKYKTNGVSIVLACHENYLIEKLADRVIVLHDKTAHPNKDYLTKVIHFKSDDLIIRNILDRLEGVIRSDVKDDHICVYVKPQNSNELLKKLLERDCYIISVNSVVKYSD
ncbi:UNVERIFIED_CONTAM: ABC-type multidrug transport system ATPase subunit [Acetivibrio alkalicellulosi]